MMGERNMGFSEKTHVFIIAKYYEHLTRAFGERGREAFIHATKYYARQRGSRMAQRVIRDGEKLDYASFCRYGEWVPSQESIEEGTACAPEVTSVAPDYEFHVHVCPWQRQFAAMGMQEAGKRIALIWMRRLCTAIMRRLIFGPYRHSIRRITAFLR